MERAERIRITRSADETRAVGGELARLLEIGDIVLLEGELGAGKTTLVRGMLQEFGHEGAVRSPTFNLLQVFDTSPPILHADLYRLTDAKGVGLEDYLDTHIVLIEWPAAATDILVGFRPWRVAIEFEGEGRKINLIPPKS